MKNKSVFLFYLSFFFFKSDVLRFNFFQYTKIYRITNIVLLFIMLYERLFLKYIYYLVTELYKIIIFLYNILLFKQKKVYMFIYLCFFLFFFFFFFFFFFYIYVYIFFFKLLKILFYIYIGYY